MMQNACNEVLRQAAHPTRVRKRGEARELISRELGKNSLDVDTRIVTAPPSLSIGVSGPSVAVPASSSKDLAFQFASTASRNGYAIPVNVDIGCVMIVNN